ncbi:MAG TPA: response regulator transcription factor [Gammaproteobacteria bacterium]|nr:response regulator transcription factor [Gammaproteobacteria bacterium]
MKNEIKVFIISSQDIYSCGLADRLNQVDHLTCFLSYVDNKDFINELKEYDANVLLVHQDTIDLWSTILPFEKMVDQFKGVAPDIRIISFDCDSSEKHARELIHCGIHGVLPKTISIDDTVNAINQVYKGAYWVERSISNNFIHSAVYMADILEDQIVRKTSTLREKLTNREKDVFKFLIHGASTKEIARNLNISEQSIKLHLGRLYKKFHVNNRTQLVVNALTHISPVKDMVSLFDNSLI